MKCFGKQNFVQIGFTRNLFIKHLLTIKSRQFFSPSLKTEKRDEYKNRHSEFYFYTPRV